MHISKIHRFFLRQRNNIIGNSRIVAEFTKPQAKVTRVLFVQARSSPAGVVEKSSSPRGACGIFPHNLARREHDLLEPVVWELRPRIVGLTRNIIMLCRKQY